MCVKSGVDSMDHRRQRERPRGTADGPVLGDGVARPVPGSRHGLLFQTVRRPPPGSRHTASP